MNTQSISKAFSVLFSAVLIATLRLAGMPVGQAKAADFTAGTPAELIARINTANTNGQADTITLTANIVLTATLPQITSQITINGAGFTLSGNSTYRVFEVTSTGNLTINNLIIANGYVQNGNGGGIYNLGTLTVNSSTFTNNRAINAGTNSFGGGIANHGTAIINDSTFNNNQATNNGGGVYNHTSANTTISNCTFSGNSAAAGAGVINQATMTITNSTFTSNTASGTGGGIRNNGTVTLNRNVFSGNTGSSGREIYNNATITTSDYNVISHSTLLTAQAVFGYSFGANDFNASSNGSSTALASILDTTLRNNGGPTQTHALVSGSPAIDRAPSSACSAAPINGIDQRSVPRNYDGNGSTSTNECDSGAYELHETITWGTCGSGTLSGSNLFDFTDHYDVTVAVTTAGSLSCLRIEVFKTTNPYGPSNAMNRWWHIAGDVPSGYTVNLTFDSSHVPETNDRVCRYNLAGATWTCSNPSSFDAINGTITLDGVTAFSDWTLQNNDPTAITLSAFDARAALPWLAAALALALLAGVGLLRFAQARQRNG